jgi:hypothetical protein
MILTALLFKTTALRDRLLAPLAMREIPSAPKPGGDVTPSNPSPSRGESCANLHAGGAGPDGESQISLTDPTAERWRRIHMLR